jgi:hypothetical protein
MPRHGILEVPFHFMKETIAAAPASHRFRSAAIFPRPLARVFRVFPLHARGIW